jgi:hypothetical protein
MNYSILLVFFNSVHNMGDRLISSIHGMDPINRNVQI